MYGLIDRAVEEYLKCAHGEGLARLPLELRGTTQFPDGLSRGYAALCAAGRLLGKPSSEMLEDLGAWLARVEPLRRILRFSGRDFRDFLLSLEELPGRAELVAPTLHIPRLCATTQGKSVTIQLLDPDIRWQHALAGLIRGMADDYGALCLISSEDGAIRVDIWEEQFAEGRRFTLHPAGQLAASGAG